MEPQTAAGGLDICQCGSPLSIRFENEGFVVEAGNRGKTALSQAPALGRHPAAWRCLQYWSVMRPCWPAACPALSPPAKDFTSANLKLANELADSKNCCESMNR
jgi:hypothetical protein